ncbi:hypothetical protein GE09DRAFT_1147940 [Coniochaeta sp. 2T2.1]|nr:hypothetical protein GE09DRAFT_1147940 [Coniochaeta sp. 2T2.1]
MHHQVFLLLFRSCLGGKTETLRSRRRMRKEKRSGHVGDGDGCLGLGLPPDDINTKTDGSVHFYPSLSNSRIMTRRVQPPEIRTDQLVPLSIYQLFLSLG